jgi:polar amino acid transport system substrate-binding protein
MLAPDEAATIEQTFIKLAIGRVDIVPSNLYTATSTLALPSLRSHAGNIVKLPIPIESVTSHIAFSKARQLTSLRDRFDAELKKVVTSGEYRALLDKYQIERTPELERFLEVKR